MARSLQGLSTYQEAWIMHWADATVWSWWYWDTFIYTTKSQGMRYTYRPGGNRGMTEQRPLVMCRFQRINDKRWIDSSMCAFSRRKQNKMEMMGRTVNTNQLIIIIFLDLPVLSFCHLLCVFSDYQGGACIQLQISVVFNRNEGLNVW